MQSFTFNRPISLLFTAPLLLLSAMFGYGLWVEFRIALLVMLLFTLGLWGLLAYMGLARRLVLGGGVVEWRTPRGRNSFALEAVRHYGIVKFRAFRFIYLSSADEPPFADETKPPQAGPDTFMVQYRTAAWTAIEGAIQAARPGLKPVHLTRS